MVIGIEAPRPFEIEVLEIGEPIDEGDDCISRNTAIQQGDTRESFEGVGMRFKNISHWYREKRLRGPLCFAGQMADMSQRLISPL